MKKSRTNVNEPYSAKKKKLSSQLAKNNQINTTLSLSHQQHLGNTRYEEALELHTIGADDNDEKIIFNKKAT